jgi:hypothetical protein
MTQEQPMANAPAPVEKTGEKQHKRVPGRPFPPGVSGNPAGRPPGSKNLTTAVREALEALHEETGTPFQKLLVNRILKLAIDGDTQMIRILWEQLDGRPAQKIIGTLTGVIGTTKVSNAKAKELIKEFNSALRASLNEDDENENPSPTN